MAEKKTNIIKNTLVLLIITVVAVLALAVVNQVTKGPIEQAEINNRAQSYKAAYPGSEFFEDVENSDSLLEGSAQMLSDEGYDGCIINDVLAVTDTEGGSVEGYVISSTSPNGYGGDIQIALGIKNDGTIAGFTVVSHNETAGFGSKCAEPEFTSQFAGKKADILEYTSSGAVADNQIDAVSGATISTGAVTEAANAAIVFYQQNFAADTGAQSQQTEQAKDEDPLQKAFPDADITALTDYEFTPVSNDQYTVDKVQAAGDKGYIITVTAHNGYSGDLQIALGIGSDGIIKGFSVLSCNETPTLGGQCESDEFAKQFESMKADKVTHVPSSASKENNEIDLIAGATITTDAVLTAVNGAIDLYNTELKGE